MRAVLKKQQTYWNKKNVYLPDASVDTVLAKLVEILGDTIHVEFKQLEYFQPVAGQEFLDLKGEPHFKVSVNGGEKTCIWKW